MSKRTIALLYGGRSGEHEVSCMSAASVLKNIDNNDFEVLLIGITRQGSWYLQEMPETIQESLPITEGPACEVILVPGQGMNVKGNLLKIDCALPVLHGTYGEDGTIQGLFEMCNIPYAGAGILGSSICIDKDRVKKLWMQENIPVVPYTTLKKEILLNRSQLLTEYNKVCRALGSPVFIKPARTGSSVGITKAGNSEEFEEALKTAFQFDTKILVERSIDAREIECSVVGNGKPLAFPPGEILPSHDFYDYDAKYLDPQGAKLLIPANISSDLTAQIMDYAKRAYETADVQGLSRVDFFLDRQTNEIYLNEINTMPGFTKISMFPRMCAAGGLEYTELITRLINLGIERFNEKNSLRYEY